MRPVSTGGLGRLMYNRVSIVGSGSAYVVGKMNGDHWLLYMTAPKDLPDASNSVDDHLIEDVLAPYSLLSSSANLPSALQASHHITPASPPSPQDQTLEILMTDLDPKACQAFFYSPDQLAYGDKDDAQQGHLQGSQVSYRLGIDTLLQDATVDSFLFKPCGYSANIVKDDRYATIHVTPESDWSYASFECNIDFRTSAVGDGASGKDTGSSSMHDLIAKVLSIFQPQRLSITLFESMEESVAGVDQSTTPETRTMLDPRVAEGYRRTDRILYEFAGYHLIFSTFEKR